MNALFSYGLCFVLFGSVVACSKLAPEELGNVARSAVTGVQMEPTQRIVFQTNNKDVHQFANDVREILRELTAQYEAHYRNVAYVTVQARTDLENQSGQQFKDEPIFEVSWNKQQLDRVDLSNSTSQFKEEILMAASRVQSFNLAGDFVLTNYCMGPTLDHSEEVFCTKAAYGLYNP